MDTKRKRLVSSLLGASKVNENMYRSDGPHIGGIIGPNRLFGGYITAQVYGAVRNQIVESEKNENVIFSMRYNFLSAGDPNKLINIRLTKYDNVYHASISHEHKAIGLAFVKVSEKLMDCPKYPSDVLPFSEIPHVNELVKLIHSEKLRNRYNSLFEQLIFEIRPHHLITIPGPGDNRVIFYARIKPDSIESVPEDGGIVCIVALSDFFVIQSAQNALNHAGFRMETGASLNHKIYFHTNYVEASQWFLVESRTMLVHQNKANILGNIFDSNKNCVLSFFQEAYCVPALPDKSKI